MIRRIKLLIASLGLVGMLAMPAGLVYADSTSSIGDNLTCGSNINVASSGCATGGAKTANSGDTSLDHILSLIVNIFSAIVGFIAVIMIIIGGVKYITSNGDSGNISSAKNTILYAVIGLVVVALAQVVVHFVLSRVANVSTN